jgi:hypothetical protein
MLERLENMPAGVDGLKAIGKVAKEDYENVFEPLLDDARRDGRRVRLLYQLGKEFEGFTAGAAWEDAKLGMRSLRLFEGCAIVSDVGWIRESARLIGFVMPCPVQMFGNQECESAAKWLATLPPAGVTSHRLLADCGIIVVEVSAPLRAQDFEALALTADTWIEAHGDLRGIVIHAREFPGWQDVGSFFRHMRFVRNHHRKVARVALAAEGKLTSLAPRIAEHFVKAQIKAFPYDALDSAIAWAQDSTEASASEAAVD